MDPTIKEDIYYLLTIYRWNLYLLAQSVYYLCQRLYVYIFKYKGLLTTEMSCLETDVLMKCNNRNCACLHQKHRTYNNSNQTAYYQPKQQTRFSFELATNNKRVDHLFSIWSELLQWNTHLHSLRSPELD